MPSFSKLLGFVLLSTAAGSLRSDVSGPMTGTGMTNMNQMDGSLTTPTDHFEQFEESFAQLATDADFDFSGDETDDETVDVSDANEDSLLEQHGPRGRRQVIRKGGLSRKQQYEKSLAEKAAAEKVAAEKAAAEKAAAEKAAAKGKRSKGKRSKGKRSKGKRSKGKKRL